MINKFFVKFSIMLFLMLNFVNADILDNTFSSSLDNTVASETSPTTYSQNITSTAVRIVVALGVVMFLYGGVSFILSLGDEGKVKKQKQNLIMTAIGLILALSSVALITIINSITKSSF